MEMNDLVVVGLSHKSGPMSVLEHTSLDEQVIVKWLQELAGPDRFIVVINTCNRRELYCYWPDVDLMDRFLQLLNLNTNDFVRVGFVKHGRDAVMHLMRVTSGLDSLVLGDFQVAGQVRESYRRSIRSGMKHGPTQRLFELAISTSRKIKAETDLNRGIASVPTMTVELIKDKFTYDQRPAIVVAGLGKIGRIAVNNLIKAFGAHSLTILNRTLSKAAIFGKNSGIRWGGLSDFPAYLNDADIVILATGATEPLVNRETMTSLRNEKERMLVDLGIPPNVERSVDTMERVQLITMEHIKRFQSSTLLKRKASISHAQALIEKAISEFICWNDRRQDRIMLKSFFTESMFSDPSDEHSNTVSTSGFIEDLVTRHMNPTPLTR